MEQDRHAKVDSNIDQQQWKESIREVQGPVEKKMRPSDIVEYDKLLTELADQLRIARHPDPLVLLRAARLLIENDDCFPSSSSTSSSSLNQSNMSLLQEQKELREQSATTMGQQTQSAHGNTAAAANGDHNGGDGASRIKRQQDDTEIRIQQSKFVLNDVMLPKSLIKSAKNNLSREQQKQQQQLVGGDEQVSMGGVGGDAGGIKPIVSQEAGTTKDELVETFERASKSLKLLYMDDQRQLQNQVNLMISSIQSITANPKTDSRLLATGR